MNKQFISNLGVMTEKELLILNNIKVLVVGLGGLGGNVANNLVRLGVQNFGLCDYDIFEISNLNRQIFSNYSNLNIKKVDVLRDEILKINPNCTIDSLYNRIQDVDLEFIKKYDYIIDTVDNVQTKRYIQNISFKNNTYVLHGACGGWYGQVGWISPSNNLLIDLYIDNTEGLEKDLKNPSFTPSAISSFMVSEFLKMIQKSDDIVIDELLLIDLKNNTLMKTGKSNG